MLQFQTSINSDHESIPASIPTSIPASIPTSIPSSMVASESNPASTEAVGIVEGVKGILDREINQKDDLKVRDLVAGRRL